jgi:dipeptidyl aminopeptidase/acylaminoacyl peptidase
VSVIDSDNGETNHRWPHFLPDGRHFLYTAVTGACCPASKAARVKIGALDTTDTVTLFEAESSAAYAEGHLLFVRDGTLMAQPFDPDSRRLSASAFPIAADVAWEGSRYASFSVSKTGALVYGHGATAPLTQLVWMDRTGKVLSSVGEPAQYLSYDLSPDGTKIAVAYYASANADRDIWIVDTVRGTRIRLTFDPGEDRWPLWSQDGLRIAFTGNRQGDWTLRQKLVNGAGDDEPLLTERGTVYTPTDWSRDGRFIAFNRAVPGSGFGDIWVLPMFGDRKRFVIVQTAANETGASFAPDGRWVAYQAVEGPQARVFVEPFPPTGAKYQISTEAGFQPRWRGDAKELFFRTADGTLMAASVDTSRQFQFDVPHALFSSRATTLGAGTGLSQPYAVTRDGQRFLIPLPLKDSTTTWLNVVLNWTATIQR